MIEGTLPDGTSIIAIDVAALLDYLTREGYENIVLVQPAKKATQVVIREVSESTLQ